ncbi:MAG: tyrosine-type recombinase/integrase [Planctomycetota bacterium]
MIRLPNGKLKIIKTTTGLRADQLGEALAFSQALQKLKSDPAWHSAARYRDAMQVHGGAARAFYGPLLRTDETWWKKHSTVVIWPDTEEEGHWTTEAIEIEEALRRAREIEGRNTQLEISMVEAEATITTLKKELGHRLAGQDMAFAKTSSQYIEWGKAKGGKGGRPWSYHHARKREEHLKWWAGRFQKLSEISLQAVEKAQEELLATKSGKTVANFTESLAGLCQWCVTRKIFLNHPLAGIRPVDTTARTTRRSLTPNEIQALLTHCQPERRIVYQCALTSGLRRSELQALTVANLDMEHMGLALDPSWTKNRKAGFQPLPSWLVADLAEGTRNSLPTAPLLPAMPKDPFHPFDKDREAAGIPKTTSKGKVDFHSLRTTFLTLVDGAGASPKTTQAAGRHASMETTFKNYVRSSDTELVRVVNDVGRLTRTA